ncbi:hypothetical protein CABS01_13926 [Colletotrichum abscissum]|uniref:uncharacterized protein n=1 Tax=Colletotrichum abscissum TaxID=1671311 RepID=UPI0027D735F5|nr:uncharacterized protein CABS01_13926 [Colletotrichum abscissum]KAK1483774.1 hypothetical protein CABS01_13926 [Colletotrichum abscissum]
MLKTSAVLLIFLFTSKAVCSPELAGDCRASFVDASLLNTQVIAVRNERYLLGISLGARSWRWGRWDDDTASHLEPSNRGIDCRYVNPAHSVRLARSRQYSKTYKDSKRAYCDIGYLNELESAKEEVQVSAWGANLNRQRSVI